ncbi:hypothetical protein J1N35_022809, partial [Gossypium stocksii]
WSYFSNNLKLSTSSSIHLSPTKSEILPLFSDINATTKAKYEKENKMVRGHILSHMSNNLFNLSVKDKLAKSIWDTLERKYGVDDAGIKKYVVGEWLKFQMIDDKSIMDQVHA